MQSALSPKSAWLSVLILILCFGIWEWYWRSDGYPASPDDNRYLWAENRAKVETLGPDDVVFIGSSRVLFDFQRDVWERETGHAPVQLSIAGGTPTPVFQDLVDNTKFNGTIIMGITPPLFFLAAGPGVEPWDHPASWVKTYYDRTYAQRFTHWVGKPFQHAFASLENDEDIFYNDLDLKTLINRIPLKGRVPSMPPFPWFQYMDDHRQITMLEKVTTDTAYAGMIKRTWQFFIAGGPPPDSTMMANAKAAVLEMTKTSLDRFRARGGQVIFVRCPSSDWFRMVENAGFPRAAYWDVLLQTTGAPGYHFEDYEFMRKYTPPEWSHLATPDAKIFTKDVIAQMQKDGVLR